MPIYEYRCTSCGVEKEMLRKVNDASLTTCPDCGKDTFQKQLSAAGFQLKGSGWYASDFKGSGKSPAKATPSEASSAAVASSHATSATEPITS
jgi:putative FmdB family regulatory protein